MDAKEYLNSQTEFNRWLKELSIIEWIHISDMLTEYSEIKVAEYKEQNEKPIITSYDYNIPINESWQIFIEDETVYSCGACKCQMKSTLPGIYQCDNPNCQLSITFSEGQESDFLGDK